MPDSPGKRGRRSPHGDGGESPERVAGRVSVEPQCERTIGGVRLLESSYPAHLSMDLHYHEHDGVTLVLQGSFVERTPFGEYSAVTGSVGVKPAGAQHANWFGSTGARTMLLDLADGTSVRGTRDRQLDGWRWLDAGPPTRIMLRVFRALRLFPEELEAVVEEARWDLLDVLHPRADDESTAEPGWIRDVYDRLTDAYCDPPTVARLAADSGVHPTYLTRRFKRHHGTTITGFVRRRRVQAALRLLADTRIELARTAIRVGFADQSHMCRVFKAETGLTPGRFRDLVRA